MVLTKFQFWKSYKIITDVPEIPKNKLNQKRPNHRPLLNYNRTFAIHATFLQHFKIFMKLVKYAKMYFHYFNFRTFLVVNSSSKTHCWPAYKWDRTKNKSMILWVLLKNTKIKYIFSFPSRNNPSIKRLAVDQDIWLQAQDSLKHDKSATTRDCYCFYKNPAISDL